MRAREHCRSDVVCGFSVAIAESIPLDALELQSLHGIFLWNTN